jgi:hypothetical protein
MAIAKRPSKQTADTEKAAEASISKEGKAPPANGKTPVLFRFKNDFLERIALPPKNMNCHVRHGSGPLSLKPWRPKGFESEIMTSKLDELLGRQPFTPFVIRRRTEI